VATTATAGTSIAPTTLAPAPNPLPYVPMALPRLDVAFADLTGGNLAGSVTVIRDGAIVDHRAFGTTLDGAPVAPSTPLVLASVSKLLTAETIAKLVEAHRIDLDERVPWTAMGVAHDPTWDTVTVRELLTHTGGMPIARASWLNLPGDCSIPLQEALATPPRAARGTWVYSNGNYCALGQAHLTTDAPLPSDGPYPQGVGRLERLGGAGTWMASSDTVATMVAAVTAADRVTLAAPGIFTDQYGWGHTGTVDGAKSCAWRLDGDRTTIVAIITGNRPGSGGQVCDLLLPALAGDLGLPTPKPVRVPD
jgi:hypothetical protein